MIQEAYRFDSGKGTSPAHKLDLLCLRLLRRSDGLVLSPIAAMAVTVYEAPHTTRHIAPRCSCAYVSVCVRVCGGVWGCVRVFACVDDQKLQRTPAENQS